MLLNFFQKMKCFARWWKCDLCFENMNENIEKIKNSIENDSNLDIYDET